MDRFLIYSMAAALALLFIAFDVMRMGRADRRVIAVRFVIAAAVFACLPVVRLLVRRFRGRSRSGPR